MDHKGSPGWLAQTCVPDFETNPTPPVCFCGAVLYWSSLPVLRALHYCKNSYIPPLPPHRNQTSHTRVCLITIQFTVLLAARVRLVFQYR